MKPEKEQRMDKFRLRSDILMTGYHKNTLILCGTIIEDIILDIHNANSLRGNSESPDILSALTSVSDHISDPLIFKYCKEIIEQVFHDESENILQMEDAYELNRKTLSVVSWYLNTYGSRKKIARRPAHMWLRSGVGAVIIIMIAAISSFIYLRNADRSIVDEAKRIVMSHKMHNNSMLVGSLESDNQNLFPILNRGYEFVMREQKNDHAGDPDIISEIFIHNVFDSRYHPKGMYNPKYSVEKRGDDYLVTDSGRNLMWLKNTTHGPMIHDTAKLFIHEMNAAGYLGYDDWRLPTMIELYSLIRPAKTIYSSYLCDEMDSGYVSAWSVDKKNDHTAFYMSFENGTFTDAATRVPHYFYPVRSLSPEPATIKKQIFDIDKWKQHEKQIDLRSTPLGHLEREMVDTIISYYRFFDAENHEHGSFPNAYKLISDGKEEYIADLKTNLMWYKLKKNRSLNWLKAKVYISGLNRTHESATSWRLPTVDELCSLAQNKREYNRLYISSIFGGKIINCWSSDQQSINYAYYYDFKHGQVKSSHKNDRLADTSVLPVRTLSPEEIRRYKK